MLCVCLDLFLLDDLFYVEVFVDRPQMMNLMWMSSKTLRSIDGIHNFHYGIKCRKIHSFPLLKGFFEIWVNFLKWYLNNFWFYQSWKGSKFWIHLFNVNFWLYFSQLVKYEISYLWREPCNKVWLQFSYLCTMH